ncbi:MAG TPA: NAD(P)H-dependent oxidoreductase subunit E [Candidatus Stercoripulliclostridium merdipullorum]|uniref:NAD(P)H-dependent oxidoreductase subunit E n=1 Tax=Candidatus Stercoripulliclostridium merdipullorum TaxID=2840952 RepID=A0A9D1NDU1_9FIRM|nr:NAD(P)H-dependent oxidoreductase subunit E [Candidatus Stercoripulliclostridium merdipullorum]
MAKIKFSNLPFVPKAEQKAQFEARLAELKGVPGALMPALQSAQEIFGYLPIEVQKQVADALDVSLEEVFGVATFYSQFTLNPRGEFQVAVCLGTACYVKGAGDLVAAIRKNLNIEEGSDCTSDGKFSLVETRCIGCCGLAPVLTVNGNVYGKLSTADIDGILAQYK